MAGPDENGTKRTTASNNSNSLPTTTHRSSSSTARSRRRQLSKTFNNLKITVLCGFITILVLRGTIGVGNLVGPSSDASPDHKIFEDIDRILSEIRSDSDPDSNPDESSISFSFNFNSTTLDLESESGIADAAVGFFTAVANYSVGPKISDWDQSRRRWISENPQFPSVLGNGKPRILLVTGSPPNPCDNAIGDHYLLKAIKNKIDYCRIHGIEIVYNTAHLDRELAGYWAKLPLIRRLLLSHPEVEWIWWMDSDALFTDMAFEIPLEKYKNHNLIIHGYPDLLFDKHSWIALNTGSFLLRNCQWTLDLLDVWAPMGPKGAIRDEAGKILTAYLDGRPDFEADDQSALIYIILTQKERWGDKVYIENSYYLHGFWTGLVDKYEEMMEKHHPGLGDERWPFVTHFVGCKPCGSYGDYPVERCLNSMERAFNFADNQVLRLLGFAHMGLSSHKIKRIREPTANPIEVIEQLHMDDKIES